MSAFLRRLGGFLNTMDAKAMTSLAVSLILLVFVVLMFVYGQRWLHLSDDAAVAELMSNAAGSPAALVGVIAVYTLLALTGFPQILLYAATVIAFGAQVGALYCWIGTMASATFTFGLGHFLGGRWVKRLGGDRAQTTIDFLGRHGVLASALIRLVPSAPFIAVNAAAGAAHIPLWKYWTGTSIGIVPKIVLIAVIGAMTPDQAALQEGVKGVLDFFTSRDPRNLALLAILIPGWLGLLLTARWYYLRLRRRDQA
jgi:uncharacterized membrane protein YdjX (TVP38/TMEM64 family)